MTDKLTDAEIKQALECCVLQKQKCPSSCPLLDRYNCQKILFKSILDLINRQKQEIGELTAFANQLEKQRNMWMEKCDEIQVTNKYLQERNVILKGLVDTQKADNERLKEQFHYLDIECERLEKENETVKAEAYKEFAERLKNEMHDRFLWQEDIDNLLKELVGEDE